MGNSFTKPLAVDTSVGRLAKLSRDIERNTRLLTDRLQAQGQEAPSFNVGGLAEFPLEDNDTEAATAREDLMVQTKELHDLIQGPRETLKNFAWGVSGLSPCYSNVTFTDQCRFSLSTTYLSLLCTSSRSLKLFLALDKYLIKT